MGMGKMGTVQRKEEEDEGGRTPTFITRSTLKR
jgi:hypothetical protein